MQLEVTVTGGTVRGSEVDGVTRYLGIPYAAAPVGSNRFVPPAPVTPWDGVRDATRYGATCPKPPYPAPIDLLLPEPSYPGEDYLNLNVWTPGGEGLPVFVWIHGGAFVNGSGTVPEYDGAKFARDGVVTVTINYRLGVEGFLAFDDDLPDNLGLRDQLAALTWVRDNIAAFGGDPARVTIGGESAGAMSTGALLSSPLAVGLFRGAILQSGAGNHAIAVETSRRMAGLVAAKLGVEPTRAALAGVPAEEILRAQSAVSLDAQSLPDPAVFGEVARNLMPFEPVIDGDVLTGMPLEAIRGGAGAGVPVLIGTNRDEHRLFMVPTGIMAFLNDDVLALLAGGYGLPAHAVETYRETNPGFDAGELVADLSTDWFFRIPALRIAEARPAEKTYVYEFQWATDAYDGKLGSCHALEIPFVFDTVDHAAGAFLGSNPPEKLAAEMHAAWVRFITAGDPGWQTYSTESRTVRIFGGDDDTETDPRSATRRLWDGIR